MTAKLTEQLKQDLRLIDPYFTQKKQRQIFGVCVNTMMKLRLQAGLEPKEKGRPKGTSLLFKDKEYPIEVQEALKRISILMQELKENTNKEPKQIEEVKELEELES